MVWYEIFVHYEIVPDKMEEIQISMLKKQRCELIDKIHRLQKVLA